MQSIHTWANAVLNCLAEKNHTPQRLHKWALYALSTLIITPLTNPTIKIATYMNGIADGGSCRCAQATVTWRSFEEISATLWRGLSKVTVATISRRAYSIFDHVLAESSSLAIEKNPGGSTDENSYRANRKETVIFYCESGTPFCRRADRPDIRTLGDLCHLCAMSSNSARCERRYREFLQLLSSAWRKAF
jgi:hypothetical protein